MPIEQAELAVEVFRMLSDTTRIRLLWELIDQELAVNELAIRVDKPAPSVSQHLANATPMSPARQAARASRSLGQMTPGCGVFPRDEVDGGQL